MVKFGFFYSPDFSAVRLSKDYVFIYYINQQYYIKINLV